VSWPNGNSFPDWNVVGFVVWIYRESANKSNSRLTPTFRSRQREIAPDSRSCVHISLLQRFALLLLRTPFHPVLISRMSSLRGNCGNYSRDRSREKTGTVHERSRREIWPAAVSQNFPVICASSTQTARRLLARNLRVSYAANGAWGRKGGGNVEVGQIREDNERWRKRWRRSSAFKKVWDSLCAKLCV